MVEDCTIQAVMLMSWSRLPSVILWNSLFIVYVITDREFCYYLLLAVLALPLSNLNKIYILKFRNTNKTR